MFKKMLKNSTMIAALALSASAYADVTIEDAYARAVPPGQMSSASFMTIKNTDAKDVTLESASSDVAEAVELHNHVHQDGVMMMRQVDGINVPANGNAMLKPGGYHVMLIGLNKDLVAGDDIEMTLTFSDGTEQSITLPVKKIMVEMKHKHGHH